MKPFRFFQKPNKVIFSHRYGNLIYTCIRESVQLDIDYRQMVKPFHEEGIEKKINVSNIMIHNTEEVELFYHIESDTNNPELRSISSHLMTISLDEYLRLVGNMEPREWFPLR